MVSRVLAIAVLLPFKSLWRILSNKSYHSSGVAKSSSSSWPIKVVASASRRIRDPVLTSWKSFSVYGLMDLMIRLLMLVHFSLASLIGISKMVLGARSVFSSSMESPPSLVFLEVLLVVSSSESSSMMMMVCPSKSFSCLIFGGVSAGVIVVSVVVSFLSLVEVAELVNSVNRSFCTDSSSISSASVGVDSVLDLFLSAGFGEGSGGFASLLLLLLSSIVMVGFDEFSCGCLA